MSQPRRDSSRSPWLLVFALMGVVHSAACGADYRPSAVVLTAVVPPSAVEGEVAPITILGENFRPRVRVNYVNDHSDIDDSFSAWLGEVSLDGVERIDTQTLVATVPATVELGVHELTVEDPFGRRVSLASAFTRTENITCTVGGDCVAACYSTAVASCVDGSCQFGAADKDSDGDGEVDAMCAGGTDCDDADANNWSSCATCTDGDGDDWYVGCDAYTTIDGPDCSDADANNWSSCATCTDGDGDDWYVGCDAYTTIEGPDCSDADANNWSSCATCTDGDGDDWYVGCDAYTTIEGPDCSDADANNWSSCATCTDGDSDNWYVGCDAYATIDGPDCDDADSGVAACVGTLANNDPCTDNTQCLSGICSCLDANCISMVCGVSECVCRKDVGGNGHCDSPLNDGVQDPTRCDGDYACFGGVCLPL